MIDLQIIIVNYNVRHFLAKCLDSIQASDLGDYTIDVWVVDNNSIDGSIPFLSENYPWINLIENKENVGFAKANNQAMFQVKAKNTLLLNPDTIVSANTLRTSLDCMRRNENIGALGVKMIDGQGKFLPESKRAIPTAWNSFCKLSGLSSLFPNSKILSGYSLGYLNEDENHEISVLCGAYMMMPTEVLSEIGLLDERFFMYAEDIDLSKRIKEAGYQVYYLADTQIIHYKGESTKKASANYVKTFYGAMYQYVEKHYSGNGNSFLMFLKLGILFRAFVSLLKRWIFPWVMPILDILALSVVLWFFKDWWAQYYFGDPDYYKDSAIRFNVISYALIWACSLKFTGWYLGSSKFKHHLSGVLLGTLIILVFYALIPEIYRSSRILILIGSVFAFVITGVSKLLYKRFGFIDNEDLSKRQVLIVANKNRLSKLSSNYLDSQIVGIINPKTTENDNYYINHIDNLRFVCKDLKVDEIVFNTDDVPMNKAMKAMESLPPNITYKIGGGSHLGLIGSKAKDSNLYSLDIRYKIKGVIGARSKRIFDIIIGLVMFVLSPFRFLFSFKFDFLKDAMALLLGMKSVVGYGGTSEDYQHLPTINSSIIRLENDEPLTQRDLNFNYAKNYNILKDFRILWKHILKK